jgi:hypothetical protein
MVDLNDRKACRAPGRSTRGQLRRSISLGVTPGEQSTRQQDRR